MKIKDIYSLLLIYTCCSCVDRYDFNSENFKEAISVKGILEYGDTYSQSIRITKTLPISEEFAKEDNIRNVTVCIESSNGDCYTLTESLNGIYYTEPNEFILEIGKSYQLKFTLPDGNQYESTPQLVYAPSIIDSIYLDYFSTSSVNNQNQIISVDRFDISIDNTPQINSSPYFRWRMQGVQEILTYPELNVEWDEDGNEIPAPLSCSIVFQPVCTCCNCWIGENFNKITTGTTIGTDNQRIVKKFIGSIPITSLRFSIKYELKVNQVSLTKDAYDFWSTYEKVQDNSGNIFDIPPVNITGNIRNINNPNERVYGLFTTYTRSQKNVFISTNDIPRAVGNPTLLTIDCTTLFNSSNIKPDNW